MKTDSTVIFTALDELAAQLDTATVHELIDVYSVNSSRQMEKISLGFKAGDLNAVRSEAHSLKSSSASLGAADLSRICFTLEKISALDHAALECLTQARALHSEAVHAMQAWKRTPPKT